jgi:ABC-2 type transport system ATP-binding protein
MLRDEGKAILMSTHDIFRAHEVADVVGIMDRGRLVMLRNREELAGENLEALYIQYMAGRCSTGGEVRHDQVAG